MSFHFIPITYILYFVKMKYSLTNLVRNFIGLQKKALCRLRETMKYHNALRIQDGVGFVEN